MKITSAQIAKYRLKRILFRDRQLKFPEPVFLGPFVKDFTAGSSFQWAAGRLRLLANMLETHKDLTPAYLRSQADYMEKLNVSS